MSELLPVIDVYAPVADFLGATIKARFDDREQKDKVVAALVNWLANDVKKRPVDNLQQRLDNWAQRIRKMVEGMQIDFSEGKLVIKVAGSDEQTLKWLQFGSDWFEPNDDLMEVIWVGLFET